MGDDVRTQVADPDGRKVVLRSEAWEHIKARHPEMSSLMSEILGTVEQPDRRQPDPRAGRERYFASGVGPSRWLRVVVAFEQGDIGEVTTAFGQRSDP